MADVCLQVNEVSEAVDACYGFRCVAGMGAEDTLPCGRKLLWTVGGLAAEEAGWGLDFAKNGDLGFVAMSSGCASTEFNCQL